MTLEIQVLDPNQLYCLSSFELQLLITPLVSSYFTYYIHPFIFRVLTQLHPFIFRVLTQLHHFIFRVLTCLHPFIFRVLTQLHSFIFRVLTYLYPFYFQSSNLASSSIVPLLIAPLQQIAKYSLLIKVNTHYSLRFVIKTIIFLKDVCKTSDVCTVKSV